MKWIHEDALEVAERIAQELRPVCARLEIVGSLRRKKPLVGDLELLYVPRIAEVEDPGSLFGEKTPVNLADGVIKRLEIRRDLSRRQNIDGRETFGELNKLMAHKSTGIPVDLFSATEENWFNQLVMRTGPMESNVAIAKAALAKGWEWKPYSPGFYRIGHTVRMDSERAVFEFVGLPYQPPELRL